jgi:hypothetical protein
MIAAGSTSSGMSISAVPKAVDAPRLTSWQVQTTLPCRRFDTTLHGLRANCVGPSLQIRYRPGNKTMPHEMNAARITSTSGMSSAYVSKETYEGRKS